MKTTLSYKQTFRQTRTFIETCLPRTMNLARCNKDILNKQIDKANTDWPYEDRVLVWIFPSFQEDVMKYHNSNGQQMTKLFRAHQLDHFDDDFHSILEKKIEAL